MRIPRAIPTQVVVGILIFLGLLFGGYFVGSTRALSTTPTYLTDSSGSNPASINAEGHLSVHIADPYLPSTTGPVVTRRILFPVQPSLTPGQCYEAYVSGPGSFISAAVDDRRFTGDGRPNVLVRLDRSVVWIEDGSADSSPVNPLAGVVMAGRDTLFGFGYTLQFKAFAGVDLCWSGSGHSDRFAVQLTVSAIAGSDFSPEQMIFVSSHGPRGYTYRWRHPEGPAPAGFELYGTLQPQLTGYFPLASVQTYVRGRQWYSLTRSKAAPTHLYVFETQPVVDSTRVGPFGSWSGL